MDFIILALLALAVLAAYLQVEWLLLAAGGLLLALLVLHAFAPKPRAPATFARAPMPGAFGAPAPQPIIIYKKEQPKLMDLVIANIISGHYFESYRHSDAYKDRFGKN